ncbi:uncharacterized protein LOC124369493 [Homalodisca vitripennis]|nr:uncharacterized protein LOC124369493 [Homalodisca vitripennis]KAG8322083.1 hypothetical protein J6590_029781 [Homalodisca vitripennis]
MLKTCVQLVGLLTVFVSSQKLFTGHCPPVIAMEGFNRDRYMGIWYQQAAFKPFMKDEVSCTHFRYTPVAGGGFQVEGRKMARMTNGPVSVYGVAQPVNSSSKTSGKYVVTLFGELVNEVSSYTVLHTDYSEISVVWSCDPRYRLWNLQNVQVLTRQRTMNTTQLLASALRALLPKHLDMLFDNLSPVDQTQCEEILSM